MNKSIEEITEKLRTEIHSPKDLNEYHLWLSGEYAFWAGQLEEILKRKPSTWLELRKLVKSDTQADRNYEMTDDGKGEIILRFRLKTISKLMSSIKTRIDVMREEARNQF